MSDLKRTEDGDVAIENGDLVLVENVTATSQDIEMTLRTWLAESVYDRNAGMPYLQVIFQPGTTVEAIRFIVEQRLASLAGVAEVVSLDASADFAARTLSVSGTVRAVTGEDIPFSLTQVAA